MNGAWHKYIAEAFGVLIIVFAASGAVLAHNLWGGVGAFGVAAAYGLAVLAVVYVSAHLSGAHFNPAITVAMWSTGHTKTLEGIGYVVAQLVGATVAAYFLKLIFAGAPESLALGVPVLGSGVEPGVGIFTEAVLTFFLVYAYYASFVDKRGPVNHAGLVFGALIFASVMVAFGITGGALNPARVFGPAFVANMWDSHFVYWLGPLIGSLLAGFVYHFGYMKK